VYQYEKDGLDEFAPLALVATFMFQRGLLVVSRVSFTEDNGEVVKCMNVDPSAKITCWGKVGTGLNISSTIREQSFLDPPTGFGKTGFRLFHTCVRPYGEFEMQRLKTRLIPPPPPSAMLVRRNSRRDRSVTMEVAQKRPLDGDLEQEPSSKREKLEENTENSKTGVEEPQDKSKRITRPGKKDKNGRSAGRRRGTRPDGEAQQGEDDKEKKTRLPKRACALLIGFSGTGYFGMQV
jgi:hypothetical protein